jgi:hypothetical protein
MPDIGEDREIKQRANAHEAEVIQQSKKLARKTKANLNTAKEAPGARSGRRSKSQSPVFWSASCFCGY